MRHLPPAHSGFLDLEVISELLGPRRIIVGLLFGSNNQRSVVTCKGDFPFPFQAKNSYELEVKSQNAND